MTGPIKVNIPQAQKADTTYIPNAPANNNSSEIQLFTPNAQQMKQIINDGSSLFAKRQEQVDPSKTTTREVFGGTVHTYYNQEGTELFTQTDIDGYGGSRYTLKDDGGNVYSFGDGNDTGKADGTIDSFGYSHNYGGEYGVLPTFQAEDTDRNGTLDQGMQNMGPNAGKKMNIEW